jgi:hypothetical protein
MYRLITITLVMMVLTIPVQSQMLDEKRTESISPSSIVLAWRDGFYLGL